MRLEVSLGRPLPADYVDFTFEYRGERIGMTLEGAKAREGHCATREYLLDTAVRGLDGWFDMPLSGACVGPDDVRQAIGRVLAEYYQDDLSRYDVVLTTEKET